MGIINGMQTNILSTFRQRTLSMEGTGVEEIRSSKTVRSNGLEVYLSVTPVDGESSYPRIIYRISFRNDGNDSVGTADMESLRTSISSNPS
jgi:hypothetical protein